MNTTWFFSMSCRLHMTLFLVFIWVHWRMGWFWFCLLSNNIWLLKVLREDIMKNEVYHTHISGRKKWQLQLCLQLMSFCSRCKHLGEKYWLAWFRSHASICPREFFPPKLHERKWGSFQKQTLYPQEGIRWQNCFWIGIIPCMHSIIAKVT